jgi:hypothetical protein
MQAARDGGEDGLGLLAVFVVDGFDFVRKLVCEVRKTVTPAVDGVV